MNSNFIYKNLQVGGKGKRTQDGIGQVVIWGKLESDKLDWDKLIWGKLTCNRFIRHIKSPRTR